MSMRQKILNPATNRLVFVDGAIGRALVRRQEGENVTLATCKGYSDWRKCAKETIVKWYINVYTFPFKLLFIIEQLHPNFQIKFSLVCLHIFLH